MDIQPIRTDQDHHDAPVEIERRWDAPEGSDDAAKLDIIRDASRMPEPSAQISLPHMIGFMDSVV